MVIDSLAVFGTVLAVLAFGATLVTVWVTQKGLDRKADQSAVNAQVRLLTVQLEECVKARDGFNVRVKHLSNDLSDYRKENYALYQQNFKLQGDLAVAQAAIVELQTVIKHAS